MASITPNLNNDIHSKDSNTIENIIKCSICQKKIKDPSMCPFCQKLYCEKCIQKWLLDNKSQCPNCKSSLRLSQIIQVSFMAEVANFIDKMSLNKKTEQLESCQKHNIKYLYFCTKCNIPLCSDCYMFEDNHKNHEIKRINDVYKEHFDLIKKEKEDLDNNSEKLNRKLKDINEKIIEIGNYKYKRSKELEDTFNNLNNQLHNNSQDLINKLIKWKQDLENKIDKIEIERQNISKEIKNSTKSILITKTNNILNSIKKIKEKLNKEKDIKQNFNLNFSNEIPNSIIPKYETAKFEINNFLEILNNNNNNNEIIYSPELRINGLIWRIKIYPKGNATAKNEYISIFLELLEGINEMSKYYYILELINFKNKNNFYQEYSSNFSNGECWGYSKFFKLSKLKEDGYIDDKGKISIKIHIRPENYFQLSRDLKNYIINLENKLNLNNNINEENNSSSELENEETLHCSYEKKFTDLNMVKSFLIEDNDKGISNINLNKNFQEKAKKKYSDNIIIAQKNKNQKFINSNENDFNLFKNASNNENNNIINNNIETLPSINENNNFSNINSINNIINNNYKNYIDNNKIVLTEQNLNYKKKYNITKNSNPSSQRMNNINENEINEKNRFQINMSLNSKYEEEDIKKLENLQDPKLIIPKENDNQSILSEDSIVNLMDSIKAIDEKKEVKNNNFNYNNLIENNRKEVKNNYFGRYFNYGLHSLSNSNSTTFKNSNNYYYGNQFDNNFKQKYNNLK